MNTPDLRGEHARELQGHRHHADGAQLRPVPAVRRAHVPREGQGAEEDALAGRAQPRRPGVTDAVDLRAIGDRIEELLDELQASADPRMLDRAEEILRLVTELYGAGLARVVELVRERAPGPARRAGRRRAGREPAGRPRPPPRRPGHACRGGAGVGPPVPRGPRRRRRAARARRRDRRRPPPPARQLRRVPVVGGHAAHRGRERHRRGRAGDRHHRRRGTVTSGWPRGRPPGRRHTDRARPQAGIAVSAAGVRSGHRLRRGARRRARCRGGCQERRRAQRRVRCRSAVVSNVEPARAEAAVR